MQFLDETLRKAEIGVWKSMPEREAISKPNVPSPKGTFAPTKNHGNLARVNIEALWRVGTRHELVGHYNGVMKRTYFRVGMALVCLAGALYCFSAFTTGFSPLIGLAAIGCAALASRYYTKAWGGYAGDWQDYEHDPIRALAHSGYVNTQGRRMV